MNADSIRDQVHRAAHIGPLTQREDHLLRLADDIDRLAEGGVA